MIVRIMSMHNWIFEIFQYLVIDFRSGVLSLEVVADEISEATSDPLLRVQAANQISEQLQYVEELDFLAIRSMTSDERELFASSLDQILGQYLDSKIYENELVTTRMSQEHIDDLTMRRSKLLARFQNEDSTTEEILGSSSDPIILFCDVCAEMFSSYINLDEHLAVTHGDSFLERYFCDPCGGLWLTKHRH